MNKVIIVFILFILLFHTTEMKAQVTQEWVSTYSTGTGYNFPKKNAIDKYGNLIVAGTSYGSNYDYIVLKYNPSGSLIWERRYNGIGNGSDIITGMILDDSNNIIVTGVSWEGINGKYNWVTIKYNKSGDTYWIRRLNWIANDLDEPHGIGKDKNGNICITGFCRTSSFQYERAMVTIKYDSNGELMWTKSYLALANRTNWGYTVATDDSNNVYASGYGAVPTGNEIVTIKYDSRGNEKWVKKYPTYYGDYLRPALSSVDKFNNLIVVAYSYSSNNYDFVTLKYTADGDLLWSRLFAGSNDDYANSLFLDDNANILIGGSSYSPQSADYLILKYSPNGDTLLNKLIEGGSLLYDQVHSLAADNKDNIYVTGYTSSPLNDYLTIKLNSSGEIIWSKIYRSVSHSTAYCLSLDSIGSVYVSGESFVPGGNTGIVTVKYSQLTGVVLNEIEESYNYELSNYPNPFNPETTIKYNLKKIDHVELKVFDILGNEVKTLINKIQNAGKYDIKFDGTNLSSGIYFYSLFINKNLIDTKRMLLIR